MFLNLTQGESETIRDYMDKYLDFHNKLPLSAKSDNQADTMRFIRTLQPATSDEIYKILKSNKTAEMESYLPTTLTTLFSLLESNIGEIQEALYMSVNKRKNETNNNNQENINKNLSNKRDRQPTNETENKNKKYKPSKSCWYSYKLSEEYKEYVTISEEKKSIEDNINESFVESDVFDPSAPKTYKSSTNFAPGNEGHVYNAQNLKDNSFTYTELLSIELFDIVTGFNIPS
ncbi:unnamed protein product [Mucor hiemalis]